MDLSFINHSVFALVVRLLFFCCNFEGFGHQVLRDVEFFHACRPSLQIQDLLPVLAIPSQNNCSWYNVPVASPMPPSPGWSPGYLSFGLTIRLGGKNWVHSCFAQHFELAIQLYHDCYYCWFYCSCCVLKIIDIGTCWTQSLGHISSFYFYLLN